MNKSANQDVARVAIVGCGPTGLAAALRLTDLNPGVHVVLYEKSSRVGGLIQTVERDGFLIEQGADSFITTKPAGVRLCERLGIADELIAPKEANRRSLIVSCGRPVPTPDNFHLIVPRNLQAILDSPLLSTAGKLRALQESAIPPGNGGDESLSAFTRRRFGAEFLAKLVQPITAGIYSADPEELSMAASLPQFLAMEREYGSVTAAGTAQRRAERHAASGARYGLFASFAGGMRRLFDVLEEAVRERCHVELETTVKAVRSNDSKWMVVSDSGSSTFDAVIVALPAYQTEPLLPGLDLGPIDRIPTASSAIVVTGHRRDNIAHPLDAFGMVVPFTERRPITAVSFASQKFDGRTPADHALLRTFIGGPHGRNELEKSDDALIEIARTQLADLLGVRGEPAVAVVVRYPHASPQYTLGHTQRVADIEAAVEKIPGLELAGASYRGVGLPDAIASGESAAERLLGIANTSTGADVNALMT